MCPYISWKWKFGWESGSQMAEIYDFLVVSKFMF
jgi:hypothetical protein